MIFNYNLVFSNSCTFVCLAWDSEPIAITFSGLMRLSAPLLCQPDVFAVYVRTRGLHVRKPAAPATERREVLDIKSHRAYIAIKGGILEPKTHEKSKGLSFSNKVTREQNKYKIGDCFI